MAGLVLDTNIVLDLFVFDEPAATALNEALQAGAVQWLATTGMRDELARVLGYPQIARRLAFHARSAEAVLAAFDRHARRVTDAPKAPFTCKDPDDQRFVDLAVAHAADLLSKDHAVLCMARRLATLGVRVSTLPAWAAPALSAPGRGCSHGGAACVFGGRKPVAEDLPRYSANRSARAAGQ